MTSKERHEARYQRRHKARSERRRNFIKPYDDFSRIANRNALSKATHDSALTVGWKTSVKRFRTRKLINIKHQSDLLENGKSIHKAFICFEIIERGKRRNIMSVYFSERIIQKSLSANALYPVLTHNLIYDNSANIRGKGTHNARRRVLCHLERHYRRHGSEGYVLQIDFKSFFENLAHDPIKDILRENFTDERILDLAFSQLDDYARYYKRPVGLGLGSEQNQIYAVVLPNRLDHFIKEKLRIKGYVRYMDDMLLIHEDKDYLKRCLHEIRLECAKYGLIINERKTHITKLSRGFTYLKTQYKILPGGHIVKKPCPESIARERRKLKKLKGLLDRGVISFDDVRCCYASWRGSLLDRDSYRTLKNMDNYFNKLFIKEWR